VVSQPRTPCWKLARRWNVPDLPRRFLRSGRTGWYLRVAQEGHVQRDAVFELLARPYPKWTIAHVNEVTYRVGAAVTSGHSP
jgi:MOSC domain-containing protein YiiM